MNERFRMSLANLNRVSQPSIEFFETDERKVRLKLLLPSIKTMSILKSVLPKAQNQEILNEEPREIQVSVEFLRFGEIDTMNEKYYAEICIEAIWAINRPIKAYDPNVEWNPKLYIENLLLDPKEEITYEIKRFYDMVVIKEIKLIKGELHVNT